MSDTVPPVALPYQVHTNRELEFMLHRGKPLAHFYGAYPDESQYEEIVPRQAFAPYVAAGTFEERVFVELLREPLPQAPHIRGALHVFYARPQHAWRIDAYIMMMDAGVKSGWSEGFERLQGSLLGYEEWQTDAHLERLRADSRTRKLFFWLRRPGEKPET